MAGGKEEKEVDGNGGTRRKLGGLADWWKERQKGRKRKLKKKKKKKRKG